MQPYNQKVDVAMQVINSKDVSIELRKQAEQVILDYLKGDNK